MSQLEQTSAILGDYMLKGWTLTDLHCDGCRTTPLMREPAAAASKAGRARIQFCARCNGRPGAVPAAGTAGTAGAASASAFASSPASSAAPAPAPADAPAPPAADPAASISALLLRGHALLDEVCPNAACVGVPLVGDRARGRKECVGCGTAWVVGAPGGGGAPESPRTRARRELYGIVGGGGPLDKGKAREAWGDDAIDVEVAEAPTSASQPAPPRAAEPVSATAAIPATPAAAPSAPAAPTLSALSATESALSSTLARVAGSLEAAGARWAADGSERDGRFFVDLKLHTEAVRDVVDLLGALRRARV